MAHQTSPEDSAYYRTYGDHAVIPETVLASPQDLIRDLKPGEWALARPDSVHIDAVSGLMTVDTYDPYEIYDITLPQLFTRPLVHAVLDRETYKVGFIADLRNIKNLMRLREQYDLSPPYEHDSNLAILHRKYGTVLLAGALLNDNGTMHWSGDKTFEDQGVEFGLAVDALLAQYHATGQPQAAPHALAEYTYNQVNYGRRAKTIFGLNVAAEVQNPASSPQQSGEPADE